ncbi:MAG: VPLPA-CTERM sorting domain-containing protein [Pseudomonadota bacterium]
MSVPIADDVIADRSDIPLTAIAREPCIASFVASLEPVIMKFTAIITSAIAFGLAFGAVGDADAKATYNDPTANVRVDSSFVDVGDRASTYQFSSVDTFLGTKWIGGGKRPADLKAILNADTGNSRLDTEGELAAFLEAVYAGTGSFANLGEEDGALMFSVTNKRGTADLFSVAGVSQVPIPGAAWLLISGVAGLAYARRRRAAQQAAA